jgi:purine nucleoside phosphorylase
VTPPPRPVADVAILDVVAITRRAPVGVIGGSGLYSLLDDAEEVVVETPYGPPSDPLVAADVGGRQVVFVPRHGRDHRFPAHRVPYRANLWALRSLGVQQVLAPCAVGALDRSLAPGDLVVPDQVIDRTSGRTSMPGSRPVPPSRRQRCSPSSAAASTGCAAYCSMSRRRCPTIATAPARTRSTARPLGDRCAPARSIRRFSAGPAHNDHSRHPLVTPIRKIHSAYARSSTGRPR